MSPPKRIVRGLLAGLTAVAGAAAVSLATRGLRREPEVQRQDFTWAHAPDQTLRVTAARPLILPAFADFDLLATVELHEQAELDVVFRLVEPSLRRGPDGTETSVPFHGRLSLLRLSATHAGPPYRTREQALFDDDLRGGLLVRAGLPASVRVEARGRRVSASVAGQTAPRFDVLDDHGGIALVARGGPVLVRYLKVVYVPPSRPWPLWSFGALAAIGATLLLTAVGASAPWLAIAMAVALPAGGWWARELSFEHLLPETCPDRVGLVLGSLWLLPLAAGLAVRRLAPVGLGALLAAGCLGLASRLERPWRAAREDPRLEQHFGPESGTAVFDALARRLRGRGPAVHTVEGPATRIFFLGGGHVFEASPDMAEHVGLLTAIAVGQRLGGEVEGMVLPTPLGHVRQQVRCLRRFYLDFAPRVVVLAVTRMEEAQVPPTTPDELSRALEELLALARERGFAIVLVAETALDPARAQVVSRFATEQHVPLVRDVLDPFDQPRIDDLVAAIAGVLR